jgi:YCII-related domain
VVDGPSPESKQLIAGDWILQVQSMDEAVEWAERFPFEALARIYPGEYGAEGSSRSVSCSSRRNEPGTGWTGSRTIAQ